MAVDLEPASFQPVVVRKHFDWPAYQDLGLNIVRLIDPEKGQLRQLRIAAGKFATSGTVEAGISLRDAYSTATGTMRRAASDFIESMADITTEHPALVAYAARCPDVLRNASTARFSTSRSELEQELITRHWFSLVLVTNNPAAATDREAKPFKLVQGPACGITDAREVAPQLAQARVAIAGIVGL